MFFRLRLYYISAKARFIFKDLKLTRLGLG